MSGGFPSLGFDPAPGDVVVARQVAGGVTHAAQALEEISAVLAGTADGEWRGNAAIAFRALLAEDLRPKVVTAARSFDEASRALHDWLDTMQAGQGRARSLETQHAVAVRRAQAARAACAAVPAAAPPSGVPRAPEEAAVEVERSRARAAAGRAADSADAEVDRIVQEAQRLLAEYEELGRQAAGRLRAAMDLAPDEPGFWQGLVVSIGAVLEEIGELVQDVPDLLDRLAPVLDHIGDVASFFGTVCGVLAWFPGLQSLAVAAVALNGVALVAHYGAAVGRTGSFAEALTDETVLMDGAGVALGAGAWVAGRRLLGAVRSGSSAPAAPGGSALRVVPQYLGPAKELPVNYFQLARSAGYRMGEGELLWRTATFHLGAGNVAHIVVNAPGTRSTATRLFDPPGPRRPSGVR